MKLLLKYRDFDNYIISYIFNSFSLNENENISLVNDSIIVISKKK